MKVGRPPTGVSSLLPHIESARNTLAEDKGDAVSLRAIIVLAEESVRRGFGLDTFARMCGVDVSTLKQYLAAKHPGSKTIARLTRALQYPVIVAPALLDKLDTRGEASALERLSEWFDEQHVYFRDMSKTRAAVREALADLNGTERKRILALFIVSDASLADENAHIVLGNALLNACELNLSTHYAEDSAVRQRRGYALWKVLEETLALQPRARKTVADALRPYFTAYTATPEDEHKKAERIRRIRSAVLKADGELK